MIVLHTSDWHLGQRFLQMDRTEEQGRALDQLHDIIRAESVDLLVVSGDVFDIGNPPFPARRLYYRFLTRLLDTKCRYIVITGGNHDAPGMLEAPKELLESLNIYVVGAASQNPADQLLLLRNEAGILEGVVAAVPFLRDRDLKYSIAGENGQERIERLRKALADYFEQMGALAEPHRHAGVPILTTGHLYATGSAVSGKQDNIYIGDVENINAEAFPEIFSYVALGHIHRAQQIGASPHVRYSGSLIPLSFSETKDEKSVYILEYEGATLKEIRMRPITGQRRLKTIEGTLDEIKSKLQAFAQKYQDVLRPWVEVIIHTDVVLPGIEQDLRTLAESLNVELLKIRVEASYQPLAVDMAVPSLNDLEPLEVFKQRCRAAGNPPEESAELEQTFLELLDWMRDQHNENPR